MITKNSTIDYYIDSFYLMCLQFMVLFILYLSNYKQKRPITTATL